jgi:L-fuculose-phosphate aldolase
MNFGKEAVVSDLLAFGGKAVDKALVWANSGNISHRLDSEKILISGSGASLGDLAENDMVIVDMNSRKSEDGSHASMETKMHLSFYKTNRNVNAVFHSQAFFTTLISCTHLKVAINLFPESMAYIGKIGRVPYNHPGSKELADAVAQKVGKCDCIILSNHGAICAAESLEDVLLKTETLEMLCRLIAIANIEKIQLNYLPQNVRDDFINHLEEIKQIK